MSGSATNHFCISRALSGQAEEITELAIRSKAHWGYDARWMTLFTEELTVTEKDLRGNEVYVVGDRTIEAFYSLGAGEGGGLSLEHLFVDPKCLRRGYGSRLLRHALERAAALGHDHLEVLADPHADGFYRAMGARLVGEVPSSIPGRSLPMFRLTVPPDTRRLF